MRKSRGERLVGPVSQRLMVRHAISAIEKSCGYWAAQPKSIRFLCMHIEHAEILFFVIQTCLVKQTCQTAPSTCILT